ncbi:MAG: NlpC/P60 family protein [Candidatus Heteroscillospira sp.]|jgi:cell wall-associated NlpC family hydrolase
MKHNLFRSLFIGAALTCLLTVSAFAANAGGGSVNASGVNLRSDMGTSSDVIASVAKDTPVVVISKADSSWYKVWTDGREGYMSSGYISFAETMDASFGQGTIRGSAVRLRSGAGTDAAVLGSFDTGTVMDVLGVSGSWYKVNYRGTLGYVHSDYMALANQSLPTPAASTPGSKIVDTGMKYMGVPYVWAGTSPKGFDCSGFVYYVFQENGYKTNRTAASLFNNGEYIDRANLQPGDIICFYNGGYSYIGHVGIYIGNNQFIHASSSGGKVEIDSLSANYYNNHYYGARRIAV